MTCICCVRVGSILQKAEVCTLFHNLQEYDDDEAVEDYYFSAAAGRARITLGNRRFGENGFVSSGRSYARPARTPHAQVQKPHYPECAMMNPAPQTPASVLVLRCGPCVDQVCCRFSEAASASVQSE